MLFIDPTDSTYAGGVKANGVANDTAAWAAVFLAASSSFCRTVVAPIGISIVNADTLQIPRDVRLIGQGGGGAAIFQTPDATGDVLSVDGGCVIEHIGFDSSAQRTRGAFLRTKKIASEDEVVFFHCKAKNAFRAFEHDSSVGILRVESCFSKSETPFDPYHPATTKSASVYAHGGGIIFVNDFVHWPELSPALANQVYATILAEDTNLTARGGQYLQGYNGIVVNPPAGTNTWVAVRDVWIDQPTKIGILLQADGNIQFASIKNCPWIGVLGDNAIQWGGAGGINVIDIEGNMTIQYHPNSGSGVYGSSPVCAASICNNIVGMKDYGFAWGVGLGAGVSNAKIDNNVMIDIGGPGGGGPTVVIQPGTAHYSIADNRALGTSGGMSDGGGAPKLVTDNI